MTLIFSRHSAPAFPAVLWPALVGLQFGIAELAVLAWGRFRLGAADALEIAAVYGLAGLALGLPAWLLARIGRREGAPGSTPRVGKSPTGPRLRRCTDTRRGQRPRRAFTWSNPAALTSP